MTLRSLFYCEIHLCAYLMQIFPLHWGLFYSLNKTKWTLPTLFGEYLGYFKYGFIMDGVAIHNMWHIVIHKFWYIYCGNFADYAHWNGIDRLLCLYLILADASFMKRFSLFTCPNKWNLELLCFLIESILTLFLSC